MSDHAFRGASTGYRPDVDGLRAIAVASVILYHLHSAWMPSGFIGVDVFFVVSGYVVSHSIADRTTGSLGSFLRDFYARRVKRLGPGLCVSTLVTAIALAILIPPYPNEPTVAYYRTGITSLVGLSNVYQVHLATRYFDGDAVPNPFMHTWSLGVEEQFYFTFPMVVFAMRALGDRRRTDRRRLYLTLALVALSLVLSAWWSFAKPVLSYFGMPGRFWELGTGCALAFAERSGALDRIARSPGLRRALQLSACVMMAVAMVRTPVEPFPFPWALPAVVATALLIASGATRASLVARALSAKPIVYVGKLSYLLYLWHWPVIVVLTRLGGAPTVGVRAIILVATVLLSVVTYHLVETPIRDSAGLSSAHVLVRAALAVTILGGITQWLCSARFRLYGGSTQAWTSEWNLSEDTPYIGAVLRSRDCHFDSGEALPRDIDQKCVAHALTASRPTLYLLGDSHARADWKMVTRGVEDDLFHLLAISHDGCRAGGRASRSTPSCMEYWQYIKSVLVPRLQPGDIVLLAQFLRHVSNPEETVEELRRFADLVAGRGATLILQAPLPLHARYAFDCIPSPFSWNLARCTPPRNEAERAPDLELLQRVVTSKPRVLLWDPYFLLCPDTLCGPLRDGHPIFRDDNHISPYGAAQLAVPFERFLTSSGLVKAATPPP
ncbi:MAG: acyltransferase family protein [Polyangiales bacterium]